MKKTLRNQKGQSATEYMLIIAIVVIGVVAASSRFLPIFRDTVVSLANKIQTTVESYNPAISEPD